ncbi:zinc ribbon domain-containing protein [Chloroflexota bacterium]
MQEVKCTNCNASNAKGLNYCTNCGNRLGLPCPQCGSIVPPDSRFCPSCAALCGSGRFGKAQHKVEATNRVVDCPQCGLPDSSGRRFCTACGARLGIPCIQCGSIVDLTSGFCTSCGCIIQAVRSDGN